MFLFLYVSESSLFPGVPFFNCYLLLHVVRFLSCIMLRTVSHTSQSFGPCIQAQRSRSSHNQVTLKDSGGRSQSSKQEEKGLEKDTGKIESGPDESVQARVERLGRARPEVFRSLGAEVAFVFSM